MGLIIDISHVLKKVDLTLLGYTYLFKVGNYISIDLRYVETLKSWEVNHISIEGEEALQLIKSDLKSFDLESVVSFVKKYPSQTF